MPANYSVQQVANWFLGQSSMSPKKLQKLMYYAYAWTLVLTNEDSQQLTNRLFDEQFEAWVHGPVLKQIYHAYNQYGFSEIPQRSQTTEFTPDVLDILGQVWDVYGGYTANELESMTHQELPWQEARGGLSPLEASNQKLRDRTVFDFYISRAAS
ncbi:Panacea domain-containing protein [Levilactobacillus cerevisiae]|uniref:Panacea domain-containing protein n=1 Tax=Levilactobacillus cerevisiae TaxID=1704076 RepID=UPI000F79B026|nr:type II toxin-antitoxin system antitoxin SocA domain-containing protein [Levilactobacillus cerevisiae]